MADEVYVDSVVHQGTAMGNLRPLWHGKKSKTVKSSRKRWKGYESLEMYQISDGRCRGKKWRTFDY